MQETDIKKLLEQVKNAEISIDEAAETLKDLPYKDMGFANIDNHRAIRTGYPEVIFCQGKTPEQIRDIMCELVKKGGNIMGTRATADDYEAVKEALPQAVFFETARIIAVLDEQKKANENLPTVAVVTAGTADIPVAEEAAVTAEILGNKVNRIYDVGVAGIHRLFDKLTQIREADVVIAVAGMEGALASVVGGLVDSPVIAVPTSIGYGANLGGISALLSMLNSCANGVAVVNIDNGFGAAYMAAVINKGK
ncbi:MAG: nickel pincer cofactor biosynthesis protein LarB [Firmicutes bacterium]|nr:nickel pincer cofactor biosynthesis protein LarB [Bacillota bacterium]MBR3787743.1 nickel pincer cofactor biosynthesis protein LarB [Bacillota bacterium]MBR6799138.1 nickel pincer cofactor biosynthesis protein LarB [Bacillota bacterium]